MGKGIGYLYRGLENDENLSKCELEDPSRLSLTTLIIFN